MRRWLPATVRMATHVQIQKETRAAAERSANVLEDCTSNDDCEDVRHGRAVTMAQNTLPQVLLSHSIHRRPSRGRQMR